MRTEQLKIKILVDFLFQFFFFLASVLFFVYSVNFSYAQDAQPVGIVTTVQGEVIVTNPEGKSETVKQGYEVFLGDLFETEVGARVKILFDDDSLISLGEDTSLEINEFVYAPNRRKSLFNSTKGKLKAIIQRVEGQSDVEFTTPNAVAGIKGTTIAIDVNREILCALEGSVLFRGIVSGSREVELVSGECSRIIDGQPTDPKRITDELKKELEEGTAVIEEASLRNFLIEEYFGKETFSPLISPATIQESSIGNIPTAQPINLLPGTNTQNQVPVEIIIQ